MKPKHIILLFITAIASFFLVYNIHLNYKLPYHVDEWHHIAEAMRLNNYGEYFEVMRAEQANRFNGSEIGFHFILSLLSVVFNLVNVYQFLPGIWTAITALVLFYVTYKKTKGNYWVSWLAMVFFISIKSNVNVTGLWFFSPLTFAIPFIFLYFYYFTEGIENSDKKSLFISFAIMLFLIPIHSISVLFAIPTLLIYCAINYEKVIKLFKPLLFALVILIFGLLSYKYLFNVPWDQLFIRLFNDLKFRYGWGVLETKNSLTEIYGWFGYLMVFFGFIAILFKANLKKYSIYLIWPATLFVMIIVYRITGVSYLSPYQRNLYYLVISLPFLSALGMYYVGIYIFKYFDKIPENWGDKNYLKGVLQTVMIIVFFYFSFANYYKLNEQFELYQVVTPDDFDVLEQISTLPRSTVMATPFVSTALFVLAHKDPVGDLAFYGNRLDVEKFYLSEDCDIKEDIIRKNNVSYIISPFEVKCDFASAIYKNNTNLLYYVDKTKL